MSAHTSTITRKYCSCLKTNKKPREKQKSSPLPWWDLSGQAVQALPVAAPQGVGEAGTLTVAPLLCPLHSGGPGTGPSSLIPPWPQPGTQLGAGGGIRGCFFFPWCPLLGRLSTPTFCGPSWVLARLSSKGYFAFLPPNTIFFSLIHAITVIHWVSWKSPTF